LRAENCIFYGLLAHWTEIEDSAWVAQLLDWEEAERARAVLERRLSSAHIGRFKPLATLRPRSGQALTELARTL